jgi:hypothetical protein
MNRYGIYIRVVVGLLFFGCDVAGAACCLQSSGGVDDAAESATPESIVLPFGTRSEDSLRLEIARLTVKAAEMEADNTSFWRRCIPSIRLSVILGVREIIFFDPAQWTAGALLPKDDYRLSLSLSITDLIDNSKHRQAELSLEKLKVTCALLRSEQRQAAAKLSQQARQLEAAGRELEEELRLKEALLRFEELRFDQGKIGFDALTRAKLDLLNVRQSLGRTERQLRALKERLMTP